MRIVALLVALLVWPRASFSGEVASAPSSFPTAFAAAARHGLEQEPFYGLAVLGAVDTHVHTVAGLATGAEVRAYLEGAAGAAKGSERLKAALIEGELPAGQAGALLTATALARPDLFAATLDALEDVTPGLGRQAAEIFAKADGHGDRSAIAALRAAGRREPRGQNGVYTRDARWEQLFDANYSPATLRETAPTAVAAPLQTYGPDGKLRGSGLLPRIPARLQLEGESILLRTPTEADVEAQRAILSDARTMEHLPHMARAWTADEVRERTARRVAAQRAQRGVDFVIVDKKSGKVIGNAALNAVDLLEGRADFGIILSRDAWGTSAAAEAHKLALEYGFGALNLGTVKMVTSDANQRMRGFLEGLGLTAARGRHEAGTVEYLISRQQAPDILARLSRKSAARSAPRILVRAEDSGFETLTAAQFEKRFGVKYRATMPAEQDAPIGLLRKHRTYRSAYDAGFGRRPPWLADQSYAAELDAGRTADLYVAKVDAKVGNGLFAAQALKRDQFLGEYTGRLRDGVTAAEMLSNGYLFGLPDGETYVDGGAEGNLLRFANHSKEKENVRVVFFHHQGYYHVVFLAKRDIQEGEQILLDYGPKYWESRGAPQGL